MVNISKQILKCKPKVDYHMGVCKIGKKRKLVYGIKTNMKAINKLMFNPGKHQTDPELFEAVVLRDKKHHFDFLTGRTTIKAIGDWKDPAGKKYDQEKNVILQVQFKDTEDERVGKELIRRFKKLNKDLIGENLLYTRTSAIEETSL